MKGRQHQTFIRLLRFRWLVHLHRMVEVRNTRKIYQANVHQKRPKGRPMAWWKDDVENGT